MKQATFHLDPDLFVFLAPRQRGAPVALPFTGSPSLKDAIESLGVPHTEVGKIRINGVALPLESALDGLRDGDEIEVHARDWSRLRPERFVLDAHLGKLAMYLRLLGFDTLWRNDFGDEELARISSEQGRMLLTRDVGLLKRGRVRDGYWLRATDPRKQLDELMDRFGLQATASPFERCLRCNGLMEEVPKSEIIERLQPGTRQAYERFFRCPECDQIFWEGPHHKRMEAFVREALQR